MISFGQESDHHQATARVIVTYPCAGEEGCCLRLLLPATAVIVSDVIETPREGGEPTAAEAEALAVPARFVPMATLEARTNAGNPADFSRPDGGRA
jgi:hypothetical protein